MSLRSCAAVLLRDAALTCLLLGALSGWACAEEPLNAPWHAGSPDCVGSPGPALEVHRYDPHTLILREGLCSTFEAPFMYLLIGSRRALLIDSGDVADPGRVALGRTLQQLLSQQGAGRLALLVAHTHRHLDHRAGDGQLRQLPRTEVIGYDLESLKRWYKLPDWPAGIGHIDLGGRALDVIPTPGHNETEVTFYDRGSGLVFCGDFLLPGRILVDDTAAYRESAARISGWLRSRPVTALLGGHIEMDARGRLFPWESTYHPNERPLPMSLADLEALSSALARFNGFYTQSQGFVLENSLRILMVIAAGALILLAALVWLLVHLRRRMRARQRA